MGATMAAPASMHQPIHVRFKCLCQPTLRYHQSIDLLSAMLRLDTFIGMIVFFCNFTEAVSRIKADQQKYEIEGRCLRQNIGKKFKVPDLFGKYQAAQSRVCQNDTNQYQPRYTHPSIFPQISSACSIVVCISTNPILSVLAAICQSFKQG